MGQSDSLQTIHFHNDTMFADISGNIDRDNCVIRGVSLITGNLQAEGHNLWVDDTTIAQLHALAVKMKKVPVTLEHNGGISDVNGFLSNFHIAGDKLKGDWHLLQNHGQTAVMLERAEKQSETFGLSVAFRGKGKMENGKNCARAEKLLSADCVKRPAANTDGLFSAKETPTVDINKTNMADNAQNQNEPSLSDIMGLLQNISERQDASEQVQSQLVDHINSGVEDQEGEGGDPTELLAALFNASDEDLAAFNEENGSNYSREQINAEVESFNASIDAEGSGQDDGGYQDSYQNGEGEMSGAGATALSAIKRDLYELKARDAAERANQSAQSDEIQFAELHENVGIIVEQRDRLIALSERLIGENEALRMAGQRGGRPAGANTEVQFTERHNGGEVIEFEVVVNDKFQSLMKQDGMTEAKAKSQAIDFGVKRHGAAYTLWRERKSPTIEFSAQ